MSADDFNARKAQLIATLEQGIISLEELGSDLPPPHSAEAQQFAREAKRRAQELGEIDLDLAKPGSGMILVLRIASAQALMAKIYAWAANLSASGIMNQ